MFIKELTIVEHCDVRVLTTQQIADAYGTDSKVISYNFNNNKERYKEGKHYILLTGDELRTFRENHENIPSKTPKLYLWTEKGAFLHAKSLGTDEAWEVYERLVDFYFAKQKQLSIPEQIQIIAKGNMMLEEKIESVNNDLQEFKKDLPLLGVECERVTRVVKAKGVEVLGGKRSEAYRDNSLRNKVYSDIYRELKRQFDVKSYKELKRCQCEQALGIIENYVPPIMLAEQIRDANAQMRF